MILSCVMLTMHFVQMMWRGVTMTPFVPQWMSKLTKLLTRKIKKPPIVTHNYTSDINTNLRRLALVSSLSVLHSLPTISGTIFADAASSFISVHHQLGFTAQETIHSKLVFEREAASIGNIITEDNTDNGVYTAKDFTLELEKNSQSNYTHLKNAHPWGCPVYVFNPRLQDGFKIPRWEPHSRRGVFLVISPLHASTVGLILNPNTNCLSPQYHCGYDDYFETVHHTFDTPPPIWEELVINSCFHNDLEEDHDIDDFREEPATVTAPKELPILRKQQTAPKELPISRKQQSSDVEESAQSPTPVTPQLSSDKMELQPPTEERPSATLAPASGNPIREQDSPRHEPRRSTRLRNPLDRFTFDKAHGYSSVRRFTAALIKCICFFSSGRQVSDMNYVTALAMDPNLESWMVSVLYPLIF
jgi:hypothetical protein